MSATAQHSDNRRFHKGSGAYKCIECGKLTRETGNRESNLRMCRACEHAFALTAAHYDGEHEESPSRECKLCAFDAEVQS